MKKIILSAIIMMAAAVAANAQFWVGGSIGYNSHNNKITDVTENIFTFSPEFGYNFTDKISGAVAFDMSFADHRNIIGVSPYVRYSFYQNGPMSIFVDGVVNFESDKTDGADAINTFGLGVRPGFAYALNDSFSLVTRVGGIGFASSKNYSEFGLGLSGTVASMGLYYAF